MSTGEPVAIKMVLVSAIHRKRLAIFVRSCGMRLMRCKRWKERVTWGKGVEGIPRVYDFGQSGDYNVMVMQLLGTNLQVIYKEKRHRFTLKGVLMTVYQMVLLPSH
eukprot:TRINITY_DN739_c0_g7_i1.p2 TRINITY_DN739_c0_g7~~TRINITY_DN739_c0_g7_i1.p2  ORF type:complete len:106 (-),score=8.98 TRINITY_DN739_c0_g7_i1:68-385(-)